MLFRSILIFSYLPLIGIIVAFKDFYPVKGLFGSPWNGLDNFKFFFLSSDAWRVLRNTIGMNLIMIVTSTVIGIFFSLLLFEVAKKSLLKIYQTIMFIPFFFSWVLVGLLFTTMLDSSNGLLTVLFNSITGQQINFYSEPGYWVAIIPLINIWKGTGFSCLIYYAVLINIDSELFEAAEIDGASKWQSIKNISLPFLIPMISVWTILAIGSIIKGDFGLFYFVTKNQAALYPVTDVIDTYVFRALTNSGNIGMSAAVGLFQSIVGFVMILLTNRAANAINRDYSLF